MKFKRSIALATAIIAASFFAASLQADQIITCESRHQNYNFCPVDTHGYVRLHKQLSNKNACRQGRSWDYDRRGIWVDDGCKAEFMVESRHHTDRHKEHHGKEAAAAVAALALIAAAATASDKDHNRYHDDDYGHAGHSSYMPRWMIGEFYGYNLQYGSEVEMKIRDDGRLDAWVDGQHLKGYVNDERAYVGDAEFYIERAGDGFNTIQVGNRSNKVHYHRK